MAEGVGGFFKGFAQAIGPAYAVAQQGRLRELEIDKEQQEKEFRDAQAAIEPPKTIPGPDGQPMVDPVDRRRWQNENLNLVAKYQGYEAFEKARVSQLAGETEQLGNFTRQAATAYGLGDFPAAERQYQQVYNALGGTAPGKIRIDDAGRITLQKQTEPGKWSEPQPVTEAQLNMATLMAKDPEAFFRERYRQQTFELAKSGQEFDQNLTTRKFTQDVAEFGHRQAMDNLEFNLAAQTEANRNALAWANYDLDEKAGERAQQQLDDLREYRDEMMRMEQNRLDQNQEQFLSKLDLSEREFAALDRNRQVLEKALLDRDEQAALAAERQYQQDLVRLGADLRQTDAYIQNLKDNVELKRAAQETQQEQFEREMTIRAGQLGVSRAALQQRVTEANMSMVKHREILQQEKAEHEQNIKMDAEEVRIAEMNAQAKLAAAQGQNRERYEARAQKSDELMDAMIAYYTDPVALEQRLSTEGLDEQTIADERKLAKLMVSQTNQIQLKRTVAGLLSSNEHLTPNEAVQMAVSAHFFGSAEPVDTPDGKRVFVMAGNAGETIIMPHAALGVLQDQWQNDNADRLRAEAAAKQQREQLNKNYSTSAVPGSSTSAPRSAAVPPARGAAPAPPWMQDIQRKSALSPTSTAPSPPVPKPRPAAIPSARGTEPAPPWMGAVGRTSAIPQR